MTETESKDSAATASNPAVDADAATTATTTKPSAAPVCAIVCGHTGATGRPLTALLLADPRVARVVTIGRHEYPEANDKLYHIAINDVKEIGDKSLPADVAGMDLYAFWVLGTTRKDAGSAQRFREIDFGGAEAFVKLCKANPIKNFMLLSSTGASSSSWFLYMKTKGEVEDIVKAAKFPRTGIFRPGLLDRGDEARMNEKIFMFFDTPMPVKTLAMALISFAFSEGDVKGTSEQKDKDGSEITAFTNSEIRKKGTQFAKDHPDLAKVTVPAKHPAAVKTEEKKPEEKTEEKKPEEKAEEKKPEEKAEEKKPEEEAEKKPEEKGEEKKPEEKPEAKAE